MSVKLQRGNSGKKVIMRDITISKKEREEVRRRRGEIRG
jgi:hypothetical protein